MLFCGVDVECSDASAFAADTVLVFDAILYVTGKFM
jgi:hypothetical protein